MGGEKEGEKSSKKEKSHDPHPPFFVPSSHPPLNLNFFLFWTKKEEIGKEHKFSAPQICTRNLISTKMSCLLTKKKGFVARHSRNAGMFPVAILSSWFIWKVLMHFLLVTHSFSFELHLFVESSWNAVIIGKFPVAILSSWFIWKWIHYPPVTLSLRVNFICTLKVVLFGR